MQFLSRYKFLFLLILIFSHLQIATACSRILWKDSNQHVLVGRNMGWYEDMKTTLIVYPRGINHIGSMDANPLRWTSKYGSIVAAVYDSFTSDGMNEAGLAAHILWLDETNYGKREENLPGLSVALWMQFCLDNFKSVAEFVDYTERNGYQVLPYYHQETKKWAQLHLAIEDESGDSAIIEYVNGKPQIYHNRDYIVLTNSPAYDLQLKNLSQYSGFGGDKPLPGTASSEDRFVRSAYYTLYAPKLTTSSENFFALLAALANTSSPYEQSDYGIERTVWRTISDLSDRVYYYNSTTSMNIIWSSLKNFHLEAGSPIMKLDLIHQTNLVGDVSKEFKPL